MAARLSVDDVLSRIMGDSDSGSEFEMSDNDDVPYTPVEIERSPTDSSSDDDADVGQGRGRGMTQGRSSTRRGRGVSRRPARGRSVSNCNRRRVVETPLEYRWEPVDFYDTFDVEWVGVPRRTGVLVDTTGYSPVQYFKLFFPDDVFDVMTTNTNLYASQVLRNKDGLGRFSRLHKWTDTSVQEMHAFVALQIAKGINNRPEIGDYWSTHWLTSNCFTDVMSRNRYQLLNTFVHFNDNTRRAARGENGYDPLFKVRPVLDITDPTYLATYLPEKDLAIDESLITYKGRIFFRQYLPAKPTKWGIKTFALCESQTGYALRLMIYTGKNSFEVDPSSYLSITELVCMEMLKDFENNGYRVYTDNYYSSPQLFSELKQCGIRACGTIKHNRKYMPHELRPTELPLNKGDDPVFMRCRDLVTCAMMDTKRVHLLSSFHSDNTYDKLVRDRKADGGHRTVSRPVMCDAYNNNMNGVDVMDQKLGSYANPHKCSKWYMTIFHRVREVALVNAYIVYCKAVPAGEKILPPSRFREQVVDGLLDGWQMNVNKKGRPSLSEKPDRLTGRHFPRNVRGRKTSTRLNKKQVQTRFFCRQCNKAMCPAECFMLYHTMKDFRSAASEGN